MIPNSSAARTLSEHQAKTGEDVWKIELSPNGRPLCRWCKKEVPKGKRTFCGDPKCVEEWKIRNSQAYARKKTYERDHGVCVRCHCETAVLVIQLDSLQLARASAPAEDYERLRVEQNNFILSLVQKGFDRNAIWNRALWQMDHIIEVVNGGGTCGLENLQTLCLPCHKKKTAQLAKDRAAARRAAREQSIGEPTLL